MLVRFSCGNTGNDEVLASAKMLQQRSHVFQDMLESCCPCSDNLKVRGLPEVYYLITNSHTHAQRMQRCTYLIA